MQAGKGLIDPCPLWDEDGKAYLVHAYAGSRAGIKHRLRVCPMAPDGSKLLSEGKIVFHEPERHPILEGPKFLKKDGWYYILAPAGGVETGWQVVLRSRNIYGPYEDKTVLAQGNTDINGPHQGALVDTADGQWWFVHFQDAALYGRIVHLQPVEWRDGWPIMGEAGEPVQRWRKPVVIASAKPRVPQTDDEFKGHKLGPQWQWHANHDDGWCSLTARPGWLRLFPQPEAKVLGEQPNQLLQKFPAKTFSVQTEVHLLPMCAGEEAGLVVAGEKSARFGVRFDGENNGLIFHTDGATERICVLDGNPMKLGIEVRAGGECAFSFAKAGEWVVIPQTFRATKGKWIGAKIGLYNVKPVAGKSSGHADFNYFRFL
jgi:beta-xylosidase